MTTSIFIFRRDYRLHDNIGLINALDNSDKVIPIFILTPEQLVNNKYKSNNAVQFMMKALDDLDKQLKRKDGKLYYFFGTPYIVIKEILEKYDFIKDVYLNMDYTPYSTNRDKKIKKICSKNNVAFHCFEDVLLNPVKSIKTDGGKVYSKFTSYFDKAKNIDIPKPRTNKYKRYYKGNIDNQYDKSREKFYEHNDTLFKKAGRKEALKILSSINKFKNYNKIRDCLNKDTTYLSAYIKFGCVSIREVYWAIRDELGMKNELIKQLYWRDFYYNIIYEHPCVLNNNMKPKYDKIKWNINKKWVDKWKNGKTGYPIVDAGMRQMNKTGYMHNRARLITSNFLIKLLGINWKVGETYFSNLLYDIDPAVNNGNWQWSSGTGADSQPYFRIFNPWTQGEDHDPDCKYIKEWIPELRELDSKDIHEWYKMCEYYNKIDYPKPMIDYKERRKDGLKMYKKIF